MTFLLDLPTETLTAILLKLDLRDLYACQQVCRHTRAVIESSCEIQYKIHLAASGAIDGPGGGLAVAGRLARLKARQRAWRHSELLLNPTYPRLSTDLNDEQSRAPVQALPFSFRGPLTAWLDGSRLRLSQPRSPTRSAPLNEWSLNPDHAGFILHSGACDLSRSTVAIFGRDKGTLGLFFQVFLLRPDGSMIPHPLAASPSFAVEVPVDYPRVSLSGTAVGGDLVTCAFEQDLYVYNWKTGRVVLNLAWEYAHLQLLDDNTLLLGKHDEIYVYIVNAHPNPSLDPPAHPLPTCVLRLPRSPSREQRPSAYSIEELQCCMPQDAAHSGGPFHDDPSSALVVLSFSHMKPYPVGIGHVLLIPHSTLLARVAAGPSVLPWEEWALENTLLLRMHDAVNSYHAVQMSASAAGSRAVFAFMPHPHDVPGPESVVLDAFVFHAHAHARPAHAATAENARRAAQYFDIVPASTIGGSTGAEASPRSLPYEIYHKQIRMTAQEAGGREDGILWLSTLFEDGLVVARTAHTADRTVQPQKLVSKLTHAYMFAA